MVVHMSLPLQVSTPVLPTPYVCWKFVVLCSLFLDDHLYAMVSVHVAFIQSPVGIPLLVFNWGGGLVEQGPGGLGWSCLPWASEGYNGWKGRLRY